MTQVSFENFDNCYINYFGTYVSSTNFYQGSYYDGDDIKGTYLGIDEYILYDSEQNEFHVLLIDGQFHDANDDDDEDDEADEADEDDDEADDDEADEADEAYDEAEEDHYYEIVQSHLGTYINYTPVAIDIINQAVRDNNDHTSLEILYLLAVFDSPQFSYLYRSEYRELAASGINIVSGRANYH